MIIMLTKQNLILKIVKYFVIEEIMIARLQYMGVLTSLRDINYNCQHLVL